MLTFDWQLLFIVVHCVTFQALEPKIDRSLITEPISSRICQTNYKANKIKYRNYCTAQLVRAQITRQHNFFWIALSFSSFKLVEHSFFLPVYWDVKTEFILQYVELSFCQDKLIAWFDVVIVRLVRFLSHKVMNPKSKHLYFTPLPNL